MHHKNEKLLIQKCPYSRFCFTGYELSLITIDNTRQETIITRGGLRRLAELGLAVSLSRGLLQGACST
jgi:hypothetical protein